MVTVQIASFQVNLEKHVSTSGAVTPFCSVIGTSTSNHRQDELYQRPPLEDAHLQDVICHATRQYGRRFAQPSRIGVRS